RVQDVVVVLEGRHDEDAWWRLAHAVGPGVQRPCRGDAVEPRHAYVHQHDVGAGGGDGGGHVRAVGHLADDLEVRLAVDDDAQASANEGLVVDEQDADGHRTSRGS